MPLTSESGVDCPLLLRVRGAQLQTWQWVVVEAELFLLLQVGPVEVVQLCLRVGKQLQPLQVQPQHWRVLAARSTLRWWAVLSTIRVVEMWQTAKGRMQEPLGSAEMEKERASRSSDRPFKSARPWSFRTGPFMGREP